MTSLGNSPLPLRFFFPELTQYSIPRLSSASRWMRSPPASSVLLCRKSWWWRSLLRPFLDLKLVFHHGPPVVNVFCRPIFHANCVRLFFVSVLPLP